MDMDETASDAKASVAARSDNIKKSLN